MPVFVLSRLPCSLWVSRTGSASGWCALQEALYKCIETIQYNYVINYNITLDFFNQLDKTCIITLDLFNHVFAIEETTPDEIINFSRTIRLSHSRLKE